MESRKDIQDELNELSPLLSKLEKREGFEVPPRYFDRLADDILRKANTSPETVAPTPQWLQSIMNVWSTIWQPRMVIGLATVAVLVLATTFFFNQSAETGSLADISNISDEELDLFIQENFDEIDMEFFADINESNGSSLIPASIDDEDLDEYFQQVIDEIDIIELEELL